MIPTFPLVDPDWLAEHATAPHVRVADVRWYLSGKQGSDEYAKGHIPGAAFVNLDSDLAAPPGTGSGRHPLPSAESFAALLASLGVTRETIVVAYDDVGGAVAARLWWLLRWFGHGGGKVLDGGLPAYTARGHRLTTDLPRFTPAPVLELVPGSGARAVDKAEVRQHHQNPGVVILDARAPERFEGHLEPVDARPGHIPGARSAPFADNLETTAGRMKSRAALIEHYRSLGALDAKRIICYCGSGVTACHDLLALAIVGRDDAELYEGSWSDWARDESLPAATGR